jgi:hypothetical protein
MMLRYDINTKEEYNNALFEIMQQTTLAVLHRCRFFKKAAFLGGSCLRFLHESQRSSENMNFSLLKPDTNFSMDNYYKSVISDFRALGRDVVIKQNRKSTEIDIELTFMRDPTEISNFAFPANKEMKINLKVDTHPPGGFTAEYKTLSQPFPCMVRCYTLPDLFAGKMHAFLFRHWTTRVKGRDWYDFEWYVRRNVPLNFDHLQQCMLKYNDISPRNLSQTHFKKLLKDQIHEADIRLIKSDVRHFLKEDSLMDDWCADYFLQLVDRINFSEE